MPNLGLLAKKRLIGPGDPVIMYGNRNLLDVVWVTPGKVFDSKLGTNTICFRSIWHISDVWS